MSALEPTDREVLDAFFALIDTDQHHDTLVSAQVGFLRRLPAALRASLAPETREDEVARICANHDESLDEAYRKGFNDAKSEARHPEAGEV